MIINGSEIRYSRTCRLAEALDGENKREDCPNVEPRKASLAEGEGGRTRINIITRWWGERRVSKVIGERN